MEFESTQAKKLVQLLDNSEAQERDYWLRRTKKVLILWLMFFVLIAMVVTFLVIDVNERSKYVDYILHYVKYGDGTHTEAEDYGTDPRKATIYDTVGSIDPPKDEEIEGFRFNGKYYNSNNYEVPIDPSSNIASSLTSEKTIYMEYEYQ